MGGNTISENGPRELAGPPWPLQSRSITDAERTSLPTPFLLSRLPPPPPPFSAFFSPDPHPSFHLFAFSFSFPLSPPPPFPYSHSPPFLYSPFPHLSSHFPYPPPLFSFPPTHLFLSSLSLPFFLPTISLFCYSIPPFRLLFPLPFPTLPFPSLSIFHPHSLLPSPPLSHLLLLLPLSPRAPYSSSFPLTPLPIPSP